MKAVGITLAGLVLLTGLAQAQTAKTQTQPMTHEHPAAGATSAPAASTSITGELVDLGCYLGHGAKGAEHKACAAKCIAGGMPMGVLTKDGALYLLTMSHSNADPFTKAKGLAAETVKVSGPVSKRDGMQSIQVDAIETAAAPSAPATGSKG